MVLRGLLLMLTIPFLIILHTVWFYCKMYFGFLNVIQCELVSPKSLTVMT